jgi:hypothetical protein
MDENSPSKPFAFAIDPPTGMLPLLLEQLIKTRAAIDALAVVLAETHGEDAEVIANRYRELKNDFNLEIAYQLHRENPPPEI